MEARRRALDYYSLSVYLIGARLLMVQRASARRWKKIREEKKNQVLEKKERESGRWIDQETRRRPSAWRLPHWQERVGNYTLLPLNMYLGTLGCP
jgi:hypothetical protein